LVIRLYLVRRAAVFSEKFRKPLGTKPSTVFNLSHFIDAVNEWKQPLSGMKTRLGMHRLVLSLCLTLALRKAASEKLPFSNADALHNDEDEAHARDEEPSTSPTTQAPSLADVTTGTSTPMDATEEIGFATFSDGETTPPPHEEAAWWQWYNSLALPFEATELADVPLRISAPDRVGKGASVSRVRRCVVTTYVHLS
jgi:hypothetical protein